MNLELIATKLLKLKLIDPDSGEGVAIAPAGPLVFVSGGGSGFYVDPKALWADLKCLSECSMEQFWERNWLHATAYETLAEVWEAWASPQLDAAMRPPKSSDYISVGRVRSFGPKEYLIQSDSGEYGIVDEHQAQKWRLTPLG